MQMGSCYLKKSVKYSKPGGGGLLVLGFGEDLGVMLDESSNLGKPILF